MVFSLHELNDGFPYFNGIKRIKALLYKLTSALGGSQVLQPCLKVYESLCEAMNSLEILFRIKFSWPSNQFMRVARPGLDMACLA